MGFMGLFGEPSELVAVVETSSGGLLAVPHRDLRTADVSLLRGLELIVLGLLALITGSRREPWRETEVKRR